MYYCQHLQPAWVGSDTWLKFQICPVLLWYGRGVGVFKKIGWGLCCVFFFLEGLSLQAKQRSAPPKKTRACLSQAPAKRGVCASVPAALLPVDATHVAAVPSTPAAISKKLFFLNHSHGHLQ
jgi:hypothetical protein